MAEAFGNQVMIHEQIINPPEKQSLESGVVQVSMDVRHRCRHHDVLNLFGQPSPAGFRKSCSHRWHTVGENPSRSHKKPGLFAREQIPISDPVRELGNLGLVAIGQDNDRELLLREPRNTRREAKAVAAMPDFLEAAILADEPSEAVARVRMLGGWT